MAGDFATLVAEVQRVAGLNDRDMGAALGVSGQSVHNWKAGAKPTLESCRAFAALSGIPLTVLGTRDGTSQGADPTRIPDWLADVLIQLSPGEMAFVKQAALGILQLRADRETSEGDRR